MFIYLVALAATIFIIFELLNTHSLNDWLHSPIRCSLNFYNGLIRRPLIETTLQNETPESNLMSERPEWRELEDDISDTFSDIERLPEPILEEPGIKVKPLKPRYSFENIPLDDKTKDFGLPVTKTLQLGTAKENTISTSKQEGNQNIFESLNNSLDKSAVNQSARLNTRQIYDLLLKETVKENEAKQKLINNQKFLESLMETKKHLPSSSKNKPEQEDNVN